MTSSSKEDSSAEAGVNKRGARPSAESRNDDADGWRGVIISESLNEPSLISRFKVFAAKISKEDLDLGEGKKGRWHLYYVNATGPLINTLLHQVKPGWYCHFWKGDDLVVVFQGKKFNMLTKDKSTWKSAVRYGRSIGIPEKELDFDLNLSPRLA